MRCERELVVNYNPQTASTGRFCQYFTIDTDSGRGTDRRALGKLGAMNITIVAFVVVADSRVARLGWICMTTVLSVFICRGRSLR